MSGSSTRRRALFSLNDTTDVVDHARILIENGWEIIASDETVEVLRNSEIEVQSVSEFTGVAENYDFPPTLHPRIEAALTGDSTPSIELVYIIPYPLEIGLDVGGRTLLALAIKGNKFPIMDREDMERFIANIEAEQKNSESLRRALSTKALREITTFYKNLHSLDESAGPYELMNGENPYQVPATAYPAGDNLDSLSMFKFNRVAGDPPCYTNLADMNSIIHTLCLAVEAFKANGVGVPYICVAAKHGNPCGMGVSFDQTDEAINRALWGNPLSIWGGEVITNFSIDKTIANLLFKSSKREAECSSPYWMLDMVVAPEISPEAVKVLRKRKSRKLMVNPALQDPCVSKEADTLRQVRGGYLQQNNLNYILQLNECEPGSADLNIESLTSLIISWSVAYSSFHGGNEIALAKGASLVSVGGGPSTVEAARTAIQRAQDSGTTMKNLTFTADAFFPFTDAPETLVNSGVNAGCVPAGGKHEQEVREYFNTNEVDVHYIPEQFRGFCRH